MLNLTKKTDYALMAINFIASQGTGVANTRTISEIYNIPLPLLAKILQRLTKYNIITSYGGPKGGYMLGRLPSQITIAEVIRAIEGPIHITRCCEGEIMCSQFERCSVHGPLQKIEAKIIAMLNGITVDEMYSEHFEELLVV